MTLLLQTISHDKAAKGLSHPVSTESLSEALKGVSQFTELKLYYHADQGKVLGQVMPGASAEKLHGAAAKLLDGYRDVLDCRWTPEEEWSITIYTVPSSRKAEIKKECMRLALPALRHWLDLKRDESWYIGRRTLQVGISEFSNELAIRETHNDRVIDQKEFLKEGR